jgi:hypothetical protein
VRVTVSGCFFFCVCAVSMQELRVYLKSLCVNTNNDIDWSAPADSAKYCIYIYIHKIPEYIYMVVVTSSLTTCSLCRFRALSVAKGDIQCQGHAAFVGSGPCQLLRVTCSDHHGRHAAFVGCWYGGCFQGCMAYTGGVRVFATAFCPTAAIKGWQHRGGGGGGACCDQPTIIICKQHAFHLLQHCDVINDDN